MVGLVQVLHVERFPVVSKVLVRSTLPPLVLTLVVIEVVLCLVVLSVALCMTPCSNVSRLNLILLLVVLVVLVVPAPLPVVELLLVLCLEVLGLAFPLEMMF